MAKAARSRSWTSLEVVKLFASILTPAVLLILAYCADRLIQNRTLMEERQSTVQEFSKFIYGRHSRASLLHSTLKRHAEHPISESLQEVIYRKQLYDEAYHEWNSNLKANLLTIRKILDAESYTMLEDVVQKKLVLKIFKPLDICLTEAYDATIRNDDALAIMKACDSDDMKQCGLDCGNAITDALFTLSNRVSDWDSVKSSLNDKCPCNSASVVEQE